MQDLRQQPREKSSLCAATSLKLSRKQEVRKPETRTRQGWLLVGLWGRSPCLSPFSQGRSIPGEAPVERRGAESGEHSIPSSGSSPGDTDENLEVHGPGEENGPQSGDWNRAWRSPRGNRNSKDTRTPGFTAALFTIARAWKQPKCPSTDERIKKMWCIYTMEYYSAIKRNEIGSFVETWMDLETVIQSEVSQKEKNKYCILMHICGI